MELTENLQQGQSAVNSGAAADEQASAPLNLEVGKWYQCRDSSLMVYIERSEFKKELCDYPFVGRLYNKGGMEMGSCYHFSFAENGIYDFGEENNDYDLIKEVPNPLGEKQATQTTQAKTDTINHPAYYGGADNPCEVIKVVEEWKLDFHLGNAVKYIARAGKKDADKTIEDLQKAIWYIQRKIEKAKQGTE